MNPPPPLRAAYYDESYTSSPTTATSTDYYSYDDTSNTSSLSSGSGGGGGGGGVWNYFMAVTIFLICWLITLVLPKGLRKQVFGAQPRRYVRRRYAPSEIDTLGDDMSTLQSSSVDDSTRMQMVQQRRITELSVAQSGTATAASAATAAAPHKPPMPLPQLPPHRANVRQQQRQQHSHMMMMRMRPPRSTMSDSETGSVFVRPNVARGSARSRASTTREATWAGITTTATTATTATSYSSSPYYDHRRGASLSVPPPSPAHPAIPKLPSPKILNETMQRLQNRGIRLVAHGVASESKRVWIKLDSETSTLTWQTEFPRKIPNQLGEISLVMMRGALHKIALPNILYVDVGKKTNALLKPENEDVLDTTCFSLLTQNGSLDLQANSRLERDALVSCFSMVLDEVHSQDWRTLYAESPDTSSVAVQSSCMSGSDLHMVEF